MLSMSLRDKFCTHKIILKGDLLILWAVSKKYEFMLLLGIANDKPIREKKIYVKNTRFKVTVNFPHICLATLWINILMYDITGYKGIFIIEALHTRSL